MKKQGFTLIELLVVITIFGILATASVQVYTNHMQKARDTIRKSDLKSIGDAMILYYSDMWSFQVRGWWYNNNGNGWLTLGNDSWSYTTSVIDILIDKEYLDQDFTDISRWDKWYMIYTCNNHSEISLSAQIERLNPNTIVLNGKEYTLEGDLSNPTVNDLSHASSICNWWINHVGVNNSIFFRYNRNYAISIK